VVAEARRLGAVRGGTAVSSNGGLIGAALGLGLSGCDKASEVRGCRRAAADECQVAVR
jgi:hypothetical protein